MAVIYGGHSADLLFHIIISELQYIIPDCSPKILSGHENYLLGAFIYWATFIYSGRIYLFCPLMQCSLTFRHLRLGHPLVNITHQSPPLDPRCSTSANLEGSAQLNRRVSGSTLLQQHHPNLTCPKNNLVVLTYVHLQGNLQECLIHTPACP